MYKITIRMNVVEHKKKVMGTKCLYIYIYIYIYTHTHTLIDDVTRYEKMLVK